MNILNMMKSNIDAIKINKITPSLENKLANGMFEFDVLSAAFLSSVDDAAIKFNMMTRDIIIPKTIKNGLSLTFFIFYYHLFLIWILPMMTLMMIKNKPVI